MIRLDAYYKFQLSHFAGNRYRLKKMLKAGNCLHFNNLFTYENPITFKKLSPKAVIDDYIVYPLQYRESPQIQKTMLFETALFLHPYGTVNVGKSEDCILFRVSEDNIFEVFIAKGYSNQTTQMLTLLVDGLLSEEIDRLLTKII